MKFYSQNGQDQIIYHNFFKAAQDGGVFLEIGADDGIDNSNTRFFEESLGWTGICIEPRPQAFSQLIKNRKCICKQAAIGNERKRSSFLSISGYGKGLSGLIDHYDDRHVKRISREMAMPIAKDSTAKTIEVEVIPIADLLTENSIHHIDFCSIDTEGSEYEIVQGIDFSKFHFNVLLIENNYRQNDVQEHLARQGFKYVGRIGADDIFVNHHFKPLFTNSNLTDSIDGVPNFRFHDGTTDSLFVYLTGLPGIDHLHSEHYFEWRHFARRNFPDANSLFLRDPANFWYLHPHSTKFGRKKTATLIESFRSMLHLPKLKVTLVGVSAGGTAALDLAATEKYGRAVAFSAQINLQRDLALLESSREIWRPRYHFAKRVNHSGHKTDLTPVLKGLSKNTQLCLVWGGTNTVDDDQHRSLMRDLPATKNIHYHPVATESHNCVAALSRATITSLLKEHSHPLRDTHTLPGQSLLKTIARKKHARHSLRSVETILENTPQNYRWTGSHKVIRTFLDNEDNPLLISFPRTGSHWLRMLMELYFDSPLLTRSFFSHEHDHYLLLHDHDLNLSVTAKQVVYLYRNPIDTIFSQMNYHRENLDAHNRIAFWTDRYIAHLSKWLYHDSFTKHKIVLRYEDLIENPVNIIKRLSCFFHLPFDVKRAEQTVRMVDKKLVKSKTSKHDPQVQKVSHDYELKRSDFHKNASQHIWERFKANSNYVGMAFDIPPETPKRTVTLTNKSNRLLSHRKKIVGLLAVRNEAAIIAQCLQSLSLFTDAIIVMDDASGDETVNIVKSLQQSCGVEKIIRKSHWHRDEPGDRNSLLQAGRDIGGTHFISLDADEMFTANLLSNHCLREQILTLKPGDQLGLVWICLWRSVLQYRYDQSEWTNNYKAFVFADDGKSSYNSEFIHTNRVPSGMKGKTTILRGYDQGVLHFQFVNWHNLLIKQAWYRCLERIRLPDKPSQDINRRYSGSKNEDRLGLRPIQLKWFLGYDFFDESAYLSPDLWRKQQVLEWFHKYGRDHFSDLDIWDIDWDTVTGRDTKPYKSKSSAFKSASPRKRTERQKTISPSSGGNATAIVQSIPRCQPIQNYVDSPLVSAIVSTYNAERYITGCLDDLLSQSISNQVEIIVVDSGSQQNEAAIIKAYQDRYANIRYIRTKRRETVYGAWNRGIRAARGKYITNANTDDRHKQDAFQTMVDILEQKPEIALVYADCLVTENENETFEQCSPVAAFKWLDWDRERLLMRGCFVGPQPMWRRSLHDEYGYFDSDLITSGDYEFWLRISQTHAFYHIPKFLGLYLRSPQSIEHRHRSQQSSENTQILELYRNAAAKHIIIKRSEMHEPNKKVIFDNESPDLRPALDLVLSECYQQAASYLQKFIHNKPDHWQAYALFVDLLLQCDREAEIPELLRPLEGRSDLPANLLSLIGSGYEAVGNYTTAADYAGRALNADLDCSRAWNLKGVLAFRNGDLQAAERHFNKAADSDDQWGEPWTNLGSIHWENDHLAKALDCFEKGFRFSPTAPNVATTYHAAVSETGHYERAKPLFEDVIARYPDFRRARFLLIDILIRLEAYQEALQQIETVLVRFGADPQLLDAAKAVRAKVGPMAIKKNKRPSLSLCMIVKNEERYLARCLQSLQPVVDEMIVVDTGSSDQTRDIAEVFGARIFDFEWKDDFAAARNYSLEKATGDWILVMDADEVIAPKDYSEIRRLVAKDRSKQHAFIMTTRNYTDRRDTADYRKNTGEYREEMSTGWMPSGKVRLFRNHQGIQFVFPVHELVDPVLDEKGISLLTCPVPVHHYGKLDSERTDKRWALYYAIGRKKLDALGENKAALKELAIQAGLLSKWSEAADYWKRYLMLKPKSLDAYLNLTQIMASTKDFAQALLYARQAFQLDSDRFETHYNLALSLLQTGEIDQALQTAQQMTAIFPTDTDGQLLQAVAEMCSPNLSQGLQRVHDLTRQIPAKTINTRIYTILSAIRSAGLNDWVHHLLNALSQLDGFNDIRARWNSMLPQTATFSQKPPLLKNRQTDLLIDDVLQNYAHEAYPAAFDKLATIISENPNHWPAYELLVDVMLQLGRAENIPDLLRPLEVRADLPARMLALIGSGYEAAGDLPTAAGYADQSLAADPHCSRAWNLKGVLAFRNGDLQAAERHFNKAADSDDQWGEPWTNLGSIHWENDHLAKALDCFEKGFRFSPTAPNVATTYHAAVSETGHYERAKPLFEDVIARYPDFRRARFLLIDILIRLEAYQEALQQIETVLVRFGADPQLLDAAKAVRAKVGPMAIKKNKRPSLSLCMIVKNEERYLARCLQSLQPVVDEMIVVDTGSSDQTRDIAEVFGARIFDFEWKDDFAAARNYSLEKATGDWILVMDADEVIASEDHKTLRNLIRKNQKGKIGFLITTRNYTNKYNGIGWESNDGRYGNLEEGCGWIPSRKTRLFRNLPTILFEYPVHELVDPALDRNGFRIRSCDVPVHHYGFLDLSKASQKSKHYHSIGKNSLERMSNDPKVIQELAVQANLVGEQEKAINLWKRLAELQPNDLKTFINLSAAYEKFGDYKNARSEALKAIAIAPRSREGHLNWGRSEFFLGNFSEAQGVFQKIVQSDSDYLPARFMLCAAQICAGKSEEGLATIRLLKPFGLWGSLPHAFKEIAEVLAKAGFAKQAQRLIRCTQHYDSVHLPEFTDRIDVGDGIGSSDKPIPLSLVS